MLKKELLLDFQDFLQNLIPAENTELQEIIPTIDKEPIMFYEKVKEWEAKVEQRGELKGIQKSIQKGVKEGIQIGTRETKKRTAINMLKEGLNRELIEKITGLKEKEILLISKNKQIRLILDLFLYNEKSTYRY